MANSAGCVESGGGRDTTTPTTVEAGLASPTPAPAMPYNQTVCSFFPPVVSSSPPSQFNILPIVEGWQRRAFIMMVIIIMMRLVSVRAQRCRVVWLCHQTLPSDMALQCHHRGLCMGWVSGWRSYVIVLFDGATWFGCKTPTSLPELMLAFLQSNTNLCSSSTSSHRIETPALLVKLGQFMQLIRPRCGRARVEGQDKGGVL